MSDEKQHQVAVAHLVSVIERAAVDLALAEEPARFIAALENEGDRDREGGA